MPGLSDVEREIRKLRKKLRQIENLERLEFEGQELSEEEENKVLKKGDIRNQLQQLLVLFAQEIETEGDSREHTEDVPDKPVMHQAKPSTSRGQTYVEVKASASRSQRNAEVKASASKTKDSTEGSGDADWTVVGEKKKTASRVEEQTQQTTMKAKEESTKKIPEKRVAAETAHVRETQPPTKIRKETNQVSDVEKRRDAARRRWSDKSFTLLTLEGHNDMVSAVYLDKEWLLSGSRDTTLKVWNVKNGFEEKSFGGHTDSVTALLLLSVYATQKFTETYGLGQHERLIISGSHDCSLKIWALNEGKLCRSIYTYNPVTALAYINTPGLIVAGSGGGKVELWDPDTGNGLQSLIGHEDAVTALAADGSMVYSASADGIVKVYQLREMELHIVHESDDVTSKTGSPLLLRHIRSMAAFNDHVYYGDDGNNVKVLDWKAGAVHKLKNHYTGDFGSTDSISCHDNTLLTSGYDLDNGVGYINVWTLPGEDYMATLKDESLSRIMCMSSTSLPGDQQMIATGGFKLQLWLPNTQKRDGEVTVQAEYVEEFSIQPEDSDLESEGDVSESDGEHTKSFFWRSSSRKPKGQDIDLEERGWFSWCQIL